MLLVWTFAGIGLVTAVAGAPSASAPGCGDQSDVPAAERGRLATEAVDDAVARFSEGALDEALLALDRADCHQPRPEHEFMRGAILVEQGACEAARARFDVFLSADVAAADAAEARRLREACVPSTASDPSTVPAPLPQEPPPPRLVESPTSAPLREREPCPPAPKPDALGIALTSAGVVLAVAGVGMIGGAASLKVRAPTEPTLADHDRALAIARPLNGAGWGIGGVGAAVLTGGIVRLFVVRARNRKARRSWPTHCRAKK